MESRAVEIRVQDDGAILGTAIPFREVTELPWGRERIDSARFSKRVMANVQHDRGRAIGVYPSGNLALEVEGGGVQFRLDPIDTREYQDTLELVRQGILSGASVEFLPVRERLLDGVRVIDLAEIRGVALVDTPAYDGATIEARGAHHRQLRETYQGRKSCLWLGV